MQRWRWVIVTDQDKKDQIAELYRTAIGPYHDAMEQVMKPGDRQTERVAKSSRYLETILERVPLLVIPCHLGSPDEMRMLLGGLGYPHEISDNLMASGFYGSIWPAVWSFMLALRSRGLGSALTTMHLAMEREIAEILEIPNTVTQIGLIPVAYFTGEDFKLADRKPAEQVTYWNAWKNKEFS
jgi:nitroreductase